MVESGLFYKTVIDPLLAPIRKHVAKQILEGENVIDVACGTGAQILEIATVAERGVGIDLSGSMIRTAKKSKIKRQHTNISFYVADATNLSQFKPHEFDVATLSFALHQFSPELFSVILNEMKRIADRIIIVDYFVPLPENYMGYASRFAEFLAGREHNQNFKKFYKLGGLEAVLEQNQLDIKNQKLFASGAFQLVVCKSLD